MWPQGSSLRYFIAFFLAVKKGDRIAQLICERIYTPELQECKVCKQGENNDVHILNIELSWFKLWNLCGKKYKKNNVKWNNVHVIVIVIR